jgi:multimeric flavodoxin WrbA
MNAANSTLRILGINASVRQDSNSGQMLEHLVALLGQDDFRPTISMVHLRDLQIDCIGCEHCYDDLHFHQDGLSGVYDELLASQILIFATPTCFGMPSALGKAFMDRSDPLWFEQRLKGKLGAVITSGATHNGRSERCRDNVHSFFEAHGMLSVPGGVCATLASEYEGQRYNDPLPISVSSMLEALQRDIKALARRLF